jgi:hypothetical protein
MIKKYSKEIPEDDMDEIAMNLNIKELRSINETIAILISNVMIRGKYHPPTNIPPYIKVENPMQQCNTLMAFSLNRKHPIFYGYFGGPENALAVHSAFKSFSDFLINALTSDLESIKKYKKEYPENCADCEESYADFLQRNMLVGLNFFGILWNLMEYSKEFDFEKEGESWIMYYLKTREISILKINLQTFQKLMSKKEDNNIPLILH